MKIQSSLLFIVLSIILFAGAVQAEKPIAPEKVPGSIRVNAETVIELIVGTPTLLVIDSRKKSEYIKGHIQGAISFLDTEMTPEGLSKHAPDKATPLLFYCDGERCMRSLRSVIKANEWGYKYIYWFRGGWNEWVEKGMPVSR